MWAYIFSVGGEKIKKKKVLVPITYAKYSIYNFHERAGQPTSGQQFDQRITINPMQINHS